MYKLRNSFKINVRENQRGNEEENSSPVETRA
jgi:hypothetical protein